METNAKPLLVLGLRARALSKFAGLLVISFVPTLAFGQQGLDAVTMTTNETGEQTYTVTLQLLAVMSGLALLPTVLIMMTSFTRIIVVLAILRQALGTAQTPSSQVLLGLALFLSLFIMAPVIDRVNTDAVQPYLSESVGFNDAVARGLVPIREFMLMHTRESDLELFSEIAGVEPGLQYADRPLTVLMPAFVTSELKTAFEIGFMLFIPFLIIDLVVASVLMSMGMMMLSPLIISFPFKIMLFVLIDGWALIMGTLASSFLV